MNPLDRKDKFRSFDNIVKQKGKAFVIYFKT